MALWNMELVGRRKYWAEGASCTKALSVRLRGERHFVSTEQENRQGLECLSKSWSWSQW